MDDMEVCGSIHIHLEAIFAMALQDSGGTRIASRSVWHKWHIREVVQQLKCCHPGWNSSAEEEEEDRPALHPTDCVWKHQGQHAGLVELVRSCACWHTLHPREQKTLLPLLQKEH